MKKRRDEFVTGWGFGGERIYGKDGKERSDSIYPLTAEESVVDKGRFGAHAFAEGVQIFRLVPVTLATVKAQAAREARAKKGKA